MLSWHYVTSAAYAAASASEKTDDKLFFLSDTKQIFKGTNNFTESVILYTTLPTTPAAGKLYIDSTTLEGKIYNGSAWQTVIQPVQATLSASDTSKPVSGKAVADYVADQIATVTGSSDLVTDVDYVANTNSLTVTYADSTQENPHVDTIPMTNVAADLTYNSTTGLLQVKNASGTAIGTGINLDLERFVQSASYEDGIITLVFNDSSNPIEIDVGDLIDTYTAGDSTTVDMTLTGNQFTAEVLVANSGAYTDNILQKTDSGLYVAPTDLSGKVDKVSGGTAGTVVTLSATGGIASTTKTIGGATLAATPSADVLATEAAVEAIRSALATDVAGKMAKVGSGHTGEIITAAADGDANASGYGLGGENFAATPNASTVATELGVVNYVTANAIAKSSIVADGNMATTVANASDTKVASEKAIVSAMSWQTSV